MKNKILVIALVAILVIAIGGYYFPQALLGSSGTRFPNGLSADSTSPSAGEVRGTSLTITSTSTVEAFTQGGCVMSTSTLNTANNITMSATETQSCRYWDVTQNRIDQTLTLPATSTITTLVPNSGDVATIWIRNATSTATAFRIAAGTGWTIQTASTTPASVASTTAGEWARMTVIRKADTDIDALFEFFK